MFSLPHVHWKTHFFFFFSIYSSLISKKKKTERRAAKKAALHAHSHSHGDESQFNLPQSGDLNDSKRFYTTHMQMADQAMASSKYNSIFISIHTL